jgi:hypothetical protein
MKLSNMLAHDFPTTLGNLIELVVFNALHITDKRKFEYENIYYKN